MPRLDYRVTTETTLRLYEAKLVLAILMDELNQLREWAGQPPLSVEDMHARVRRYIQAHPQPQPPREAV